MGRNAALVMALCALLALTAQGYEFKSKAQVTLLTNIEFQKYPVSPRFSTSEPCTVRHDVEGDIWAITHYLYGPELYKSYQNPALACDGPYPFSVEKIYIVLWFGAACSFDVSVDVETADLSQPSCPFPGELISISTTYTVTIPGGGLYQIEVPLDSPTIVNEAYFAGFYFATYVDTLANPCLVTDDVPTPCVSYNIWDTTIGYVDLYDVPVGESPSFPGRLLLFSAGTPGGSGGEEPEPSVTLLTPGYNELITGEVTIWAAETAGSNIIDFVRFDYRSSDAWFEIGRDYDGSRALRNSVDPSGAGKGYTVAWDYSGLSEGVYWLKATVYDSLGRTDVDSLTVSVDPTPPNPVLINPGSMDTICAPLTLEASTGDENVTLMKFEKKDATMEYQAPVVALSQSHYGDRDGDPGDGNPASAGEYGDYYCGPVAGAIAIKYWFDKGFIYSMREGNQYLPLDTVVERLAANILTRRNEGTYDDLFFSGMQQYIATHGNELRLGVRWNPDYAEYRTLLEERELLLILGLSGSPGVYLVAAGASGTADTQGRYNIKVSDPVTGTIVDLYLRNIAEGSEIYYGGGWHSLDVIITVVGHSHTVSRDFLGADNTPTDGWLLPLTSPDMHEDSLYFISATAVDATARADLTTSLVLYKCTTGFIKGDYNGDGETNIGDALYLIEFIYKEGDPPVGGAGRADANCDTNIDISDVIFLIKYLLAAGDEPCY
jgi:hypothetical protein